MGNFANVVIAVLILLLSLFSDARELYAATGHSITTWRGNHPAALTLTFDDNYLTQHTFALPALKERGFRSTLFVITDWAQWDWYVEAANEGHEIGAHTLSHPYLTRLSAADAEKEIAASQAAINSHVPGQKCLTFAYPYGDVNPLVEGLVMKYYIGARGAVISNDLYNETSYDVSIRSVADMEKLTEQAVSQGTWLIPMFHSFDPAEYGKWTPEMFLTYMDYLHDRSDLWVAPFGEVIKYIRERSAAAISASSTSGAITVKLTHDLDSTVFNYPLTLRSVVPAQWATVDVQQGGKSTTVSAVPDQGEWVVYYDAVPNGGDITLSQGASAAVALGALALTPNTVTAGASSQGTVRLTAAAPTGGVTVGLQSDSSAAGVPVSVTVPAGESSQTFAITTTAVSTSTTVNISAAYGGETRTARLAVIPPGSPIVAITAPAGGTSYLAPATVSISATATAAIGAIVSKVEFFAGTNLVGTATTAPYSVTWNNVAAGSYSLTARSTDSAGGIETSAPVSITVVNGATLLPVPWATQDVGDVGLAGTGTFRDGAFSLKGAGYDIWGSADSFRFVYQPLVGDGQITARVASLQSTNGFAKAGVMLRESLSTDSPQAMMVLTPTNGARFGSRATTGGAIGFISLAGVAPPYWVKLARSANTFTGYVSKDGVNWVQVAKSTVAMSTSLYAGLVLTNHDNTTLGSSTMDGVEVTGTSPAAPTVTITVPTNGASYYNAPAAIPITATATGGTGATVARVDFYAGTLVGSATSGPYSTTWGSAAAGSYSLRAVVTDSLGRTGVSGPVSISVVSNAPPTVAITAPASGASYRAPATVSIGATATAGAGATVSRVEFYAGATLIGSASASPYAVTWSNVPAGSYSLTAKVIDSAGSSATSAPVSIGVETAGLPAPWVSQDIGSVVLPGTSSFADGTFSVEGGGYDIYGAADSFRYVYQQLNGDGQIVARVVSQQNTNDFAKAGVMIRESLADNASDAMMVLTPVNGARFGRRATPGATTDFTPLAGVAAPYWVKLARSGNKFTGFVSKNGTDWQQVGSSSLSMGNSVYIGLAVSSHDPGKLCLTTFDSVSGLSQPPTVRITAPVDGASYNAPAAISMTATAAPGSGAGVEKVEFYADGTLVGTATAAPFTLTWSDVAAGTHLLTAKVTDTLGATATSTAVSISVVASTPPTVSVTAPADGASLYAPATIAMTATVTAGGGATVSKVDFYAGATLVGTATAAPYSVTWSDVAVGTYSLTAKVTDSLGATATSSPVSIGVVASTPPTVSITAPAEGASFYAPAAITMAATVTAGSGATVSKVDFYAGATLVGTATAAPYSATWSDVAAGTYSLTAKVTDSLGATATSGPVSIRVVASTPPTVSVTAPADGASLYTPATIAMTATVTAGGGATVSKVDFYAGATLVGTATAAPYSVTWSDVAVGTYSLTAKVTDSLGATATSGPVSIRVVASTPPTVSITAPAEGASLYAPAIIAMSATVTAGSGATVSKVDFYAGATLVGTATAAPYSVTWSDVAVGTYSLTAKVTDSLGATATSSPVSISVVASTPPTASITAPAEGASLYAPATIAMSATVTAGSGATVSKVDFYAGATLVGTATAAPYSVTWSDVAVGTHSLTAKVTDSLGATATSSPVSISVVASSPPTASITAPAEGASLYAPATIAMSATVIAGSGATVSKVDFYAGATLVGTATAAPYSVTWSDVAVGTHLLTAKVTDSLGGTATSTPVSVTVVASLPPAVSITAPADRASYYAPATIDIAATATPGTGAAVTKVEFYAGATLVGSATAAPYAVTWSNVAEGSYSLTAKVIDSLGATATSTPVAVTVVASIPPAVSITAPADRASYYAPATLDIAATATPGTGAAVTKVEFYAGATLVGSATAAPYAVTWSDVAEGSYSLMAKVTDSLGATATSNPIAVSVVASIPPAVSITAPADGASFYAPARIEVAATAKPGRAPVSKVDFYAGATLIGTATAAPYSVTWSDVAVGTYSLTATVTDTLGGTAMSPPVAISVVATVPPAVSITIPADGASFYAPASIEIAATAMPGSGASVTKVEFYAGATLVGSATATPFSFTWRDVAVGTYSLTAKVTDSLGGTATSTPVAISVVATIPPAVSITAPADGASYYAPATIDLAATATPGSGATVSKVEFYAGATLVGTATAAPFNVTWRDVAVGTYSLTVKVTDSQGGTATSSPVAIGVVATISPAVSITAPADGASYYAPATIDLAATATPGSGATVSKVEFYAGATLVGTATAAPFSFTWRDVPVGTYSLTAKITDSQGGTATSNPVGIGVVAAIPPAVSITAPVEGASFYAPATIEVAVTATPGSGASVTKVEFYAGGTLVGTATTAPFSFTWRNVAVGTYTLTAKVTDSLGGTATSSPVAIGVVATIPPAVSITAPADGASFYAPATIEIAASATPGSGATVSRVEFYAGATLVGTATAAPFSFTWRGVAVGSYSLTAKITDSLLRTATSAPVGITVVAKPRRGK
jgi:peptidoglycan/xylan/chitin deacetylase (PgdA/CDA1 family)